jgi:hypothetical protein
MPSSAPQETNWAFIHPRQVGRLYISIQGQVDVSNPDPCSGGMVPAMTWSLLVERW